MLKRYQDHCNAGTGGRTQARPETSPLFRDTICEMAALLLSYTPMLERNTGHDPALAEWESAVLPITLISHVAESVGFEPTVPCDITGFQDQHNKPLCQLSELHDY